MTITKEQIGNVIKQLEGVLALFNPADAAILATILMAATELNGLIKQIKTADPAAWAAMVANYTAAEDAFNKSQPQV